ncbi:unnamed protein product [Sphagnum jensenii]|uniref:Uncharacterized protein n=1 Tax=Sphagnum jensenii TaxID=128206 RepID=A0ABP0X008_9BRYO
MGLPPPAAVLCKPAQRQTAECSRSQHSAVPMQSLHVRFRCGSLVRRATATAHGARSHCLSLRFRNPARQSLFASEILEHRPYFENGVANLFQT